MDEGCTCNACDIKRAGIANKILKGVSLTINDKIKHEESKHQLITKRVTVVNKLNNIIKNMPPPKQRFKRGKDFKQDMTNIVKGKTRF
jgi:hypothetical protein